MTKKVNPLEGTLETLRALGYGNSVRDANRVYREEWEGIIVDTCVGFDTGAWETGVKREGGWTIVEQYEGEDDAKAGHEKWVAELRQDPKVELRDIDFWGINAD